MDKRKEFAIRFGNSPFKTAAHAPSLVWALAMPVVVIVAAVLLAGTVDLFGDIGGVSAPLLLGPMRELVEKRKELDAKRKRLKGVYDQAGPDMDLSKVKQFGDEDWSQHTTVQKTEEIRKANHELTDIAKECEALAEVEKAKSFLDSLEEPPNNGNGSGAPAQGIKHGTKGPDSKKKPELKTLGEMLTEGPQFKKWFKENQGGRKELLQVHFDDVYPSHVIAAHALKQGDMFTKTLFETGAGWAPESLRIGRVVDAATRPIELLQVIPLERTSQAAVVYMEETTRTHAAAETNEGEAYPEATFALTEQSSTVRKIAESIPVTDEQLDDVPLVRGYLNNRLIFGLRQRLDGQVLSGDGSAPNLTGILNVGGIQTQAKGGDVTEDAIYKAMDLVAVTGRAIANACVLHRNDWQTIRLRQTADGIYIWGSPSEAGPDRIWGIPVVKTTQSENTGLVGDFANFCGLFERKGVSVEVGYVDTQFTEGEKTIRAQMRAAFVVFRAAAFCTITGI